MPSPATLRSIEFHNTSLGAVLVALNRADPAGLADDMHKMFGGQPDRFNQEPAILDFGALALAELPERIDWTGLMSLMRRYRLQPVGVRNLMGDLNIEGARRVGLATLDGDIAAATRRPPPAGTVSRPVAAAAAATPTRPATRESAVPPLHHPPAAAGTSRPTLYVERVVRSGQQIYAQGGDLVLMAGSSPGSEVIADGNIHCYGPLAGRALAGARGDANARIVATCFGPELVAVAGVYRTFEGGVPSAYAGQSVVVKLKPSARNQSIVIEPLQID
ncbi:MAG: septum site-determining protein MinC [Azoarcus sp.]|jgi:septum site-determining protein MinC|nr:septum site-determining protein MinC [Azoarcus sp.]